MAIEVIVVTLMAGFFEFIPTIIAIREVSLCPAVARRSFVYDI